MSVALVVASIRLALWLLPFRTVQASVERLDRQMPASNPDPKHINRTAWAVQASGRIIPGATCLTQALATRILLARRGYATKLQIGIARGETGTFEAHAWVEYEGDVVVGKLHDLERFVPLFPRAASTAADRVKAVE